MTGRREGVEVLKKCDMINDWPLSHFTLIVTEQQLEVADVNLQQLEAPESSEEV